MVARTAVSPHTHFQICCAGGSLLPYSIFRFRWGIRCLLAVTISRVGGVVLRVWPALRCPPSHPLWGVPCLSLIYRCHILHPHPPTKYAQVILFGAYKKFPTPPPSPISLSILLAPPRQNNSGGGILCPSLKKLRRYFWRGQEKFRRYFFSLRKSIFEFFQTPLDLSDAALILGSSRRLRIKKRYVCYIDSTKFTTENHSKHPSPNPNLTLTYQLVQADAPLPE